MTHAAAARRTDVIVVGDGIIGLSIAAELARRGANVTLGGAQRPGVASAAAAGLLAPSIGSLAPHVLPFYLHSLSLFPEFISALGSAVGSGEGILTRGVIELPTDERAAQPHPNARQLSREDLAALDPAVVPHDGAWYHPDDGAVNLPMLMTALRRATGESAAIGRLPSEVVSLAAEAARPTVLLKNGATYQADTVVLAAGSWTPLIGGLPRALPIRPLKGEIISLDKCPLRTPLLAGHVYLVPRGTETIVGATSEDVGFNVNRNPLIATMLHRQAAEVVPALEQARVTEHWAGFRPATPDMLPIIGREPLAPGVVYACGHGRNGILLAPATARAVAALCGSSDPEASIAAFAPDRVIPEAIFS